MMGGNLINNVNSNQIHNHYIKYKEYYFEEDILEMYVKASKEREFKLNIIVNFELITDIAAAIHPIYNKDGSIDEAALTEYDEFLINLYSVFDYNEFELIKEEQSNKSETSMYYALYKKSESNEEDIKCIVFVRVSDHDYQEKTREDKKKTEKHRKKYFTDEAERMKQPKDKKRQRWKIRNVVVNNEKYSNDYEALDAVDRMLEEL